MRDQKPSGGCTNCGAPIRTRKPEGWLCAECAREERRGSILTLRDAAGLLGVTPDTLRQQIAKGKFRASKVGRDWLVNPSEVKRYREEHKR